MTTQITPTDPRPALRSSMAIASEVIGGIRADQMNSPTPCEEFAVRDLLAHLADVGASLARVGRNEEPFFTTGESTPAPDDQWAQAWADAVDEVEAAWVDDESLRRTVVLPWAEGTGADLMRGYVNEILVHTWDLAKATGQDPVWDDELVAVADEAIREVLPTEGREEAPFNPPVDTDGTAPAMDRLVAYNGRDPRAW